MVSTSHFFAVPALLLTSSLLACGPAEEGEVVPRGSGGAGAAGSVSGGSASGGAPPAAGGTETGGLGGGGGELSGDTGGGPVSGGTGGGPSSADTEEWVPFATQTAVMCQSACSRPGCEIPSLGGADCLTNCRYWNDTFKRLCSAWTTGYVECLYENPDAAYFFCPELGTDACRWEEDGLRECLEPHWIRPEDEG